MITSYQAKYYAEILTQKSIGGNIDSLSQSLLNAAVDINPHQIEAALFAFQNPLSKGVIMADEVGLGKTIEAGLVLCQYWAIGKRKIIVICPAALRKQWSFELTEKFGIDNEILDSKNYNEYLKKGKQPFSNNKVIICSYNFAARKANEIKLCGFNLAVIDEAHKLRNVYKKNAKTAIAIKESLINVKKLLLTATPFQNSLMELYGLASVIDDEIFGNSKSFRAEYVNEGNIINLQQRLSPFYKRTLRREVTEYINYTKRLPLTQKFIATDLEQKLYDNVSEFLRRDDLFSVPKSQRMLTTMIIRKILASSTFALLGTLETIKSRLKSILESDEYQQLSIDDWIEDSDIEYIVNEDNDEFEVSDDIKQKVLDRNKLLNEITEIDSFIEIAKQIKQDSKATALLKALDSAFSKLPSLGANKKVLIFTESTRTQKYLKEFLNDNGYNGKIVLFNGSNSDKESNEIYNNWATNPNNFSKISGIKVADRRAAIVDYFRNSAEIMIATEAAAEGLNLQFCSLVVNYDLPWNPQRIEQRIGRCHRYGQKSDVVVVNFVNQNNFADIRVFNLLSEKFNLFDDVFGASDEVLGQIDGLDFEKRIWSIYQECRTEEEINAAFENLQEDMKDEIDDKIDEIKTVVLQNFDIDVQERLRLAKEETNAFLNRYEFIFWELTKYILSDKADFDDIKHTFVLKSKIPNCPEGKYYLIRGKDESGYLYRFSGFLAQYVINEALKLKSETGKIIFSSNDSPMKITLPDYLKKESGYLIISKLQVSAFDTEEYSLITAYTKDGKLIKQEDCERLFLCGGYEKKSSPISEKVLFKLKQSADQHASGKLHDIDSRNLTYFHEEEERIFQWERDMVFTLEHELDIVKRQIREQERLSRSALSMEEKLAASKKLEELERQKRRKRNELADREDEIAERRRNMIEDLDKRMIKETKIETMFVVEWQTL